MFVANPAMVVKSYICAEAEDKLARIPAAKRIDLVLMWIPLLSTGTQSD
jgi:hypothetical protein